MRAPPQVTVGRACRLDPFSAALPGLALPPGASLAALGTRPAAAQSAAAAARAAKRAPEKHSAAWAAAETKIASERLDAATHAALQVLLGFN